MADVLPLSATFDSLPLRVLYSLPTQHPRITIAIALSAVLATPPWLSYRAYAGRKAAAGVYTADFAGWLRRMLFLPFFRETLSTEMYDADPNKNSWLDRATFPSRQGERPTWDSSAGPQRQVNQLPSLEMRKVCRVL